MRNKSIILIAFLAFTFSACEKELDSLEKVTINLEECVERKTGEANLRLCFDEVVQDSRCPANANCVWRGVAVAKFTLTLNGTAHQLELSTNNELPGTRTDTTIQQYTISFKNLHPYRGLSTGEPINAEMEIIKR